MEISNSLDVPASRSFEREGPSSDTGSGNDRITGALLDRVVEISRDCGASALFISCDAIHNFALLAPLQDLPCRLLFVTRSEHEVCYFHDNLDVKPEAVLRVPEVPLTRLSQIKVAVFLALSRGLIADGDVVVFFSGPAGSLTLDMLFIMEVGKEKEMFSFLPDIEEIPDHLRPEVVARVIDIATEIGSEGREGKPLGALFVIGDTEHVMALSRQLVLNPFRGYSPEERNILDPKLDETVKEFAAIDGAFIIRKDGVIEACGVFLEAFTSDNEELPQGLGARHHTAAGITAVSDSIAVAISESTGTVTIFRGGKILTEVLHAKRRTSKLTRHFPSECEH